MRRIAFTVAAALLSLAFAGCQSLSPAKELDQAGGLVQERAGLKPAWQTQAKPGLTGKFAGSDWDGRRDLTAAEAIRIALNNSPSIRSDLADIAAARADLVQAGLLPNPMLNVMAKFDGNGASMLDAGLMQAISALWLLPSRTSAAHAQSLAAPKSGS